MRRVHLSTALALGCLLPLVAACNEGPAREALAESEQALTAARPQLEQFAPEELAALQASAAEARAHLEAGRYTDALAASQTLPSRIEVALDRAEGRKGGAVAEWTTLASRVPPLLDSAEVRAQQLALARSLPRTLTPEMFAKAQTELAATRQSWTEAKTVFEAGQVTRAVAAGRAVQRQIEIVAAQLGLTPTGALAAASATGRVAASTATPAPVAAPTPAASMQGTSAPTTPAAPPAAAPPPPPR